MKCSVVIPSISRSLDLRKCLQGISDQSVEPHEVLVVTQDWDVQTKEVALEFGATVLVVPGPGVALAIEYGIRMCHGDVVCLTDDDAVPHSDWLEKIQKHFVADPRVGVVCGRDILPSATQDISLEDNLVGVIRRGKIYGNHHVGGGLTRQIDHAKGANMAVRRVPAEQVLLGSLVRGKGAQVANELIISLGITSQGYKCIFDPDILVNHFPAPRQADDSRDLLSSEKVGIRAYNRAYAVARFAPFSTRLQYLVRSFLIGDRMGPGIFVGLFLCFRGIKLGSKRFLSSMSGLFQAYRQAMFDRMSI